MDFRSVIQNNIAISAVGLFLVFFLLFNLMKPAFAFTKDGHLRDFGINYKNKTVFPVWLIAIILAIVTYFFVTYYLAYPRINFKHM